MFKRANLRKYYFKLKNILCCIICTSKKTIAHSLVVGRGALEQHDGGAAQVAAQRPLARARGRQRRLQRRDLRLQLQPRQGRQQPRAVDPATRPHRGNSTRMLVLLPERGTDNH